MFSRFYERPKESEAPEPAETPKGERPPAPQGEAQAAGRPRMGVEIQRDGDLAWVRLRGGRANAMSATLPREEAVARIGKK